MYRFAGLHHVWPFWAVMGLLVPICGGCEDCPDQPDEPAPRTYVVVDAGDPTMVGALVTVAGERVVIEYEVDGKEVVVSYLLSAD